MGGRIVQNPYFPHDSNFPWMWESDDERDQDYWDAYNEAEEQRLRENEYKNWQCVDYCPYASHCFKHDLWSADRKPENCSERASFEDYEWDAICGGE